MHHLTSPQSIDELLTRARRIAGLNLAEISQMLHMDLPKDLKRDKGYIGLLVERALGARAGSKPEQDFPHLNVELKRLIGQHLQPLETTFVTSAPLLGQSYARFEDSVLYLKLKRVLWVPVEGERAILERRRVGTSSWEPSPAQWQAIRQDWEEAQAMISTEIDYVTAKQARLQVRPNVPMGAHSHRPLVPMVK